MSNEIIVTSTRLPEFTRVIEFTYEGKNYWSEYWLTDSSFDWVMADADGNRLDREAQIKLFDTNDDNLNEVIDSLIEKAEDYEVDQAIKWRERVQVAN